MPAPIDLAGLKADDFAPHIDEIFEMQIADGNIPLKLVAVDSSGPAVREGGAFSLSFVAPAGPWQPQATYPIRHPSLGVMEIFLVPAGPVSGGNGYHATFT